MVYDGDGNRVAETVGGVTTHYLIDDRNPTGLTQVMDEVMNGAVTKTYAYGLQRISENQLISGAWTPSFYGYDGHGNVRYLTNSAGAITDTYNYDAFGLPISTTGSTPNAYTYSGERFDQNIGLFHLRARDYNPLTGRFETMDPAEGDILNPATLHKYVYAGNNPVNASDPTGRDIFEFVETSPRFVPAAAEAAGQLYAGAMEFAAAANTYANIAYLTTQDMLNVISDVAITKGVAKVFACGFVAGMAARFFGEENMTDTDKLLVNATLAYTCAVFIPFPGPPTYPWK
jgi:RHS repeat-associated protein